jgi:hypothetical protein
VNSATFRLVAVAAATANARGEIAKSVMGDKAEPPIEWPAGTTKEARNAAFGEIVAYSVSRLLRWRFRLSVGRVVTNALIDKAMLSYG